MYYLFGEVLERVIWGFFNLFHRFIFFCDIRKSTDDDDERIESRHSKCEMYVSFFTSFSCSFPSFFIFFFRSWFSALKTEVERGNDGMEVVGTR